MPFEVWYFIAIIAVCFVWFVIIRRPMYEALALSFVACLAISGTWRHRFGHHFAVGFSRFEPEGKRISRLESGQMRFECRKQEAAPEYELERTFGRYGFDDRSVDFQLVA